MTPAVLLRLDRYAREEPRCVAGPAASPDVEAAERRVGMSLPPDFREFVLRYGGALVGSLPVYGVRTAEIMGDPAYETFAAATSRFRKDGWPGTADWIVVSTDLGGNPIGLTSRGAVWTYDHDAGEMFELAPSFEAWVSELLDEADAAVAAAERVAAPRPTAAAFRVLLAEVRTGILLRAPGLRALNLPSERVARRFRTLDEARAFAAATIRAHPDVECSIQDGAGNPVEQVRDVDGSRRAQEPLPAPVAASRWQRLRAWVRGRF